MSWHQSNKKGKGKKYKHGPGVGHVGSLLDTKGFGFIVCDDIELDDLFFHFSEYPDPGNIKEGTRVSFDCVRNEKLNKYKATNIKILQPNHSSNHKVASYSAQRPPSKQRHGRQYRGQTQPPQHSNAMNNTSPHGHQRITHQSGHASSSHSPPQQSKSMSAASADKNKNKSKNKNKNNEIPKYGCFKMVKKDVTDKPMYIPVFPLGGLWKTKKQFV